MKGFPTESSNLSPSGVGVSHQSDDSACCSEDSHTCNSVRELPAHSSSSSTFCVLHQAAWHLQPSLHQLARKACFHFQVNRLLFPDYILVVCSLISTVLVLNFLDNFFSESQQVSGWGVRGSPSSRCTHPPWELVFSSALALPYYTYLCVLAHAAYLSRIECSSL